jgi:hypothetical protein
MPRLHISEDVLARSADDQTVLLNLETGHCYVLNGIAGQMWSLLRGGDEPEAVVERLLQEYDIEAATLRGDVEDLVHALVERGLAREQGPDGA